jgi:hypothetical protein
MWTIAAVVALAAPLQSRSPIAVGTESSSVPTAAVVGTEDDEESALDAALDRAGDRAETWRAALAAADDFDTDLRADLGFLVTHMPTRDLLELDPKWVVRDATLAREAWSRAPWHEQVPLEMYRDAILPYANVDEPREDWRPELRARFLPLVEECTTPGEAAQVLNREVFAALGVKYSTKRARANQAPSETIEQGLASCTGLSILLADACRAVGVPARLAGIGAWPHKNGNHTWIEVWDGEGWRFTGAAEYDANGLDRAWFVGDARRAQKGDRLHAVMATTWRGGGGTFHLPWAPEATWVNGVDVTEEDGKVAVRVRVWADGERVATDAFLSPRPNDGVLIAAIMVGRSRGATADMNDMLEFRVEPGTRWKLSAKHGEVTRGLELGAVTDTRTVDLDLTEGDAQREVGGQEREDDLVRSDPARARPTASRPTR